MATEGREGDRHSEGRTPDLITDPHQRAERESLNGVGQVRVLYEMIDEWLQPGRIFQLRPSRILQLHRPALDGLSLFAGLWRPGGVDIHGSRHNPPGAHLVAGLIEELCDYVNSHWDRPAIHLASYVMWRLNWIHPFDDGNGRTARAVAYLVLCTRLGFRPPGEPTIPDQIVSNRKPYYTALEAADASFAETGVPDISAMEKLLADMLAAQLLHVVERAYGQSIDLKKEE
jgi:Fic family protein